MEEQKNIDQSGMTFLKATTGQLPAVAQTVSPAFPPNTPQSDMPQDGQKAAEQAMKQVGTPTAFAPNIFTAKQGEQPQQENAPAQVPGETSATETPVPEAQPEEPQKVQQNQ
jgi:hypothetical protein